MKPPAEETGQDPASICPRPHPTWRSANRRCQRRCESSRAADSITGALPQAVVLCAVIYQEGLLGSMFLGGSKVDPLKFGEFLNKNAREGWRVKTMEKDMRHTLLCWKREAYLVIMERA